MLLFSSPTTRAKDLGEITRRNLAIDVPEPGAEEFWLAFVSTTSGHVALWSIEVYSTDLYIFQVNLTS
jgi:hypothetical protein